MSTKLQIAFFPAHPSQIWVLGTVAREISDFAQVHWFIRDKDINRVLADDLGLDYKVISIAGRGLIGNGLEYISNISKTYSINEELDVDLWVTKYGACHLASFLQGRKTLSFIDDDIDLIPIIALTSYPFVDEIISTHVTRMGLWNYKVKRFRGNFELSYLHPNRFTPDSNIRGFMGLDNGDSYAIVRLSSLQAHHDMGKKGLDSELLEQLIRISLDRGIKVLITSEKELDKRFEPFRMMLPPARIHSALAQAEFVLGDSQTMIQEAAVLGTPAIRVNDFVGRISIISQLEKAGLAFGFNPHMRSEIIKFVSQLVYLEERNSVFRKKRNELLQRWEDPVPLFVSRIKTLLGLKGD